MKKISTISGQVIPLKMDNIDTDLIIPSQYLTQVTKKGYSQALFRRLRDSDPEFVFNQPRFQSGKILISGRNFGCGSSREHAVWALLESGIEAIIAVSFSDIFYSNSAKNGLLLITQPEHIIQQLTSNAENGDYFLTIDIDDQKMITRTYDVFPFEIEPFLKFCFLQGLDELDYLLMNMSKIEQYEITQREKNYSTIFSTRHGIT